MRNRNLRPKLEADNFKYLSCHIVIDNPAYIVQ
jgi:hypothetical protein